MHRLPVALALSAWLGAAVAQADAIAPEPHVCPPGTLPRSDHAGPRCEPRFCGRDVLPEGSVDCGPGASCRDALIRYEVPQPIDWERPGFPTVRPHEGDCACPPDDCQRADVCVPDGVEAERCGGATPPREGEAPSSPPARGGCASCALHPGSSDAGAGLALALLALLAVRRRA